MKIKEVLLDARTYILAGIFILAFVANFMGFLGLPTRVAFTETALAETRDSVTKLADTVEDYILVQQLSWKHHEKIHEEGAKREKLITDLIMEVRSEKNHDH